MNRRQFVSQSVLASTGLILTGYAVTHAQGDTRTGKPVVISTWPIGLKANEAAWDILKNNGTALDAVEQGVRVPEADPEAIFVGYGGLPDRTGRVTLDASIMDHKGNCGAVAYLEHIKHPISVARLVMDKTPHVMLAGQGALDFALKHGHKKENLLTEGARKRWEDWKKQSGKPIRSNHSHDTIGMLALDTVGNLSGACTTSGQAWKLHGRVGDSPIIGAGLYVDNEVGAATATGMGEAIIKTCGSFLIVELMRTGKSPQQACEEAVKRTARKIPQYQSQPVHYIALDKHGRVGAYGTRGFEYALCRKDSDNRLFKSDGYVK